MKLLPAPSDRGRSGLPTADAPRILLLEQDPYLAFLLRLHVPEAAIIEPDGGVTVDEVATIAPDLVVTGIESSPVPITQLLSVAPRLKIVAVVDGPRAARSALPSAVDGVVARPFAPADLTRAIRGALGIPAPEEDRGAPGPTLQRARAILPPARLAAVALAAVLELAGGPVPTARAYILAIAFGYVTLRWLLRRPSVIADAADVAVATILVASTGGIASNYTFLAVVTAIGAGIARGPNLGALGGLVIVAATMPVVIGDLNAGLIDVREVVAWGSLFPLLGMTGGFAARVWRKPDVEGLNVLVEANRVLSSLYRIARTLPGGLEIGSVAEAAMHEIRDALGARAGAMLLSEAGAFSVVGSFGVEDPGGIAVREDGLGLAPAIHGDARIIRREQMHPATAAALGSHECWLAAPMRREGIPQGLLLVACPDEDKHEANSALLRRLADEATVAVENARLFSRVREISIDEERKRLARELHDGVAQALTHLRYELDFIAKHGSASESARRDILRLMRVAERTSGDVRSMIMGLRASVSDEGLVGALRSYLQDLRRLGGPEIEFDARGEVTLPGDIEGEMFRVGQEAVSNALRHANARHIWVRLRAGVTHVRLAVEDDGIGVQKKRHAGPGGVGLDAMRERATLIGATLTVASRTEGGTVVSLDYPVGGN